jgi:hypothetical protein
MLPPPSSRSAPTTHPSRSIHLDGALTAIFNRTRKKLNWENKVTLRSLDFRLEYEATAYLGRISPTPLLMIIADNDTITPTDIALRAFELALEPKKIILLQGDHSFRISKVSIAVVAPHKIGSYNTCCERVASRDARRHPDI